MLVTSSQANVKNGILQSRLSCQDCTAVLIAVGQVLAVSYVVLCKMSIDTPTSNMSSSVHPRTATVPAPASATATVQAYSYSLQYRCHVLTLVLPMTIGTSPLIDQLTAARHHVPCHAMPRWRMSRTMTLPHLPYNSPGMSLVKHKLLCFSCEKSYGCGNGGCTDTTIMI